MPNDQLDAILSRLVSGTDEVSGAELEQLRCAILGTLETRNPSAVADIAAELDALKDCDQGDEIPCELKSAEDYLARVTAEDQPIPASLLRLVGAAPALRTTANVAVQRSRMTSLRQRNLRPWGGAIAATVLAGISGYLVHDLIARNPSAPANVALPNAFANARPPESANSAVASATPAPPQEAAPSPNMPALAVTLPTPITSHAVVVGDYPPESIRLQEQGTVKVRYRVLINGSVGECQVESSSGYSSLDDAACVLVKRWRFKPAALTDGTAVDWWLNDSVAFRLVGGAANSTPPQPPAVADAQPSTTGSAAVSGSTPPIATTSHAVTADDYPPVSIRLREQGKVRIKYLVKEDGSVAECNVATSSGKARLDDAACTMAKRRWKFKPATLNGKPVAEFLTAEVAFNLNGGAANSTPPQAPAIANAQSSPAPARRGLQTKNEALVRAITDMNNAARAQNWAVALEKAKEADAIKDDKPAALNAPIHLMIVTAAINAHDYAAAMAQIDKNIAAKEGDRNQNLKQGLSVAIMAKNKEKTDEYAKDLGGNLDNETRLFIASNMLNSGQAKEALDYAKPALEGNASEAALKFEEAAYFKMNNLAGRRTALEQLVTSYPKLEYWHDLLQLARNDKGLSDDQTMDIYRLRLAVGDLKTDADFQEMAQEALVAGYATEAKGVLDKAQAEKILSGERDQRLVKMATDRATQDGTAIADLQKRAGADPNSAVKLGLLYWSTGKNQDAEDTLRKAIASNKLADPDRAQMALGHVLLSEGKNQEARAAFRSVRGPNAASVAIAAMWASFAIAPAQPNPGPSRPPPIPPVATTSHAVTEGDYPPESIRQQEQGKVALTYLVKDDGSVGDCHVTQSSGWPMLDDAACAMVMKRWKFKPATQNGKDVAEYLTAEVVFQLK